jgi:hypothetical protein
MSAGQTAANTAAVRQAAFIALRDLVRGQVRALVL